MIDSSISPSSDIVTIESWNSQEIIKSGGIFEDDTVILGLHSSPQSCWAALEEKECPRGTPLTRDLGP